MIDDDPPHLLDSALLSLHEEVLPCLILMFLIPFQSQSVLSNLPHLFAEEALYDFLMVAEVGISLGEDVGVLDLLGEVGIVDHFDYQQTVSLLFEHLVEVVEQVVTFEVEEDAVPQFGLQVVEIEASLRGHVHLAFPAVPAFLDSAERDARRPKLHPQIVLAVPKIDCGQFLSRERADSDQLVVVLRSGLGVLRPLPLNLLAIDLDIGDQLLVLCLETHNHVLGGESEFNEGNLVLVLLEGPQHLVGVEAVD